jgi:tRNA threonylcarbamoyladenosine biosynthesis protein TsaB
VERRAVIVLGIDTSTPQTSVAIGSDTEILARVSIAGRSRQESVTPALEHLLEWSGLDLQRIGGVAVGVGPGLFTGLRVGVETAKTLAQVLGVPIASITSLDALAYTVRYTSRRIAAVIDARRGEVYFAFYRQVPGGVQRLDGPSVGSVDDLVAELLATGEEALLVGDGALRHRDRITAGTRRVELAEQWLAHPSAAPLVQLAHAKALREDWVQPAEVQPLYLRKPDAEIGWATRETSR